MSRKSGDRFSDKDMRHSKCPGKVETGFPIRTCATQSVVERIPLPFERDTLQKPRRRLSHAPSFLRKCGIHRSGTCGKKAPFSGAMEIMAAVPNRMTAIAIRAPGGPDVLIPEERDVPRPAAHEVLVPRSARSAHLTKCVTRVPDAVQRAASTCSCFQYSPTWCTADPGPLQKRLFPFGDPGSTTQHSAP